MHSLIVACSSYFYLPFRPLVPSPTVRCIVDVVDGNFPIGAFLMDEEEVSDLRMKKRFRFYAGSFDKLNHDIEARLPHQGMWYLVLINKSDENIPVNYSVEIR